MTEVEVIKKAIEDWDLARKDTTKATDLLEKGAFFRITRNEYETWGNLPSAPEKVYAFPGIFNMKLKFVVIDSETAKHHLDEKSLPYTFVKEFTHDYNVNSLDFLKDSVSGNIDLTDALKRTVRWNIMMHSWIKEHTAGNTDPENGVFKSFGIPFESINNSFVNPNVNEIIVTLALKPVENAGTEGSKFNADVVLWSTEPTRSKSNITVQNVGYPCPPFCDLPDWP